MESSKTENGKLPVFENTIENRIRNLNASDALDGIMASELLLKLQSDIVSKKITPSEAIALLNKKYKK